MEDLFIFFSFFLKCLKVLLYNFLICLLRVTARYFMFLEAIVKGIGSLISFSFYLSFRYRKTTYLYIIILYSVTLLTGLISSRSFLVEYLWALMHSLTSSANKDTLASFLPVCIHLISFSYFNILPLFCLFSISIFKETFFLVQSIWCSL